jgi:hypothetical protein
MLHPISLPASNTHISVSSKGVLENKVLTRRAKILQHPTFVCPLNLTGAIGLCFLVELCRLELNSRHVGPLTPETNVSPYQMRRPFCFVIPRHSQGSCKQRAYYRERSNKDERNLPVGDHETRCYHITFLLESDQQRAEGFCSFSEDVVDFCVHKYASIRRR